MTGHVLHHRQGTSLEAYDRGTSNDYRQWKLVPCHNRFFAFLNIGSTQYLCDTNPQILVVDDHYDLSDEDRIKCWELVSYRQGSFDFVSLVPGVIFGLAAHELGQAGANGRHFPQLERVTDDASRAIIWHCITQWETEEFNEEVLAPIVKLTTCADVEHRRDVSLPQSLNSLGHKPTLVQIRHLRTYGPAHERMAVIEGYFLEKPVFSVRFPVGVHLGRETVRMAMSRSLSTGFTEMVIPTPIRSIPKRVPTMSASPLSPRARSGDTNIFAMMVDQEANSAAPLKHEG